MKPLHLSTQAFVDLALDMAEPLRALEPPAATTAAE